ncbi:MAG: Metalloprotease TldD [Syntrophomonadaceae bacterium]|nr:Metalloprotease TldD [Bacillota bacterium]
MVITMISSDDIEYAVIQRSSVTGVALSNGICTQLAGTISGSAYRRHTDKYQVFRSSNAGCFDFLERQLGLSCLPCVGVLQAESCLVPTVISNQCSAEIARMLASLGTVINLSIIIKFEELCEVVYAKCEKQFVDNSRLSGSIEYNAIVDHNGTAIIIKREFFLPSQCNIDEQLYTITENILHDYLPLTKRDFVELGNAYYHLILPPGKGGILIHETIGHALEADHFYSSGSIMRKKWHKKVADSNISVSDSCNSDDIVAYNYSTDGKRPQPVELIKNGVVQGLLTDQQTARVWGLPDTGNGRASSYEHPAIPRMRNTFLHNGLSSRDAILSDTKNGIYAMDIGGGQVNIKTGDFLFNITTSLLINDGETTNLVKPFLFIGNLLDTLSRIDMIGNDMKHQIASCGKKGQSIQVSYGQPTVRIAAQALGRSK